LDSVLIVDDDPIFRGGLARNFRARGLKVQTAGGPTEAMRRLEATPTDLVVIDLFLPELSGLELLVDVRRVSPSSQVVIISGYSSVATAVDAIQLGATNYLTKPTGCAEILAALEPHDPSLPRAPLRPSAPSLARVEWEHLNRVVSDCDGNITTAARRLSIDRRTLQRKLRKRPPKR
jgi:two-component system response regulator RegA